MRSSETFKIPGSTEPPRRAKTKSGGLTNNMGGMKQSSKRKTETRSDWAELMFGLGCGKQFSISFLDVETTAGVTSMDCGFGFSQATRLGLEGLEKQFERNLVEGLSAIVIPAGGGKSTLAEMFNQIDVDQVLPVEIEDAFKQLRYDLHINIQHGSSNTMWTKHNHAWVNCLRLALRSYDFSKDPRVIFVHSPEIAALLGAKIIGILVPSETLHHEWMAARNPVARAIGSENRDQILACCPANRVWEYRSARELRVYSAKLIANAVGYCAGLVGLVTNPQLMKVIQRSGFDPMMPPRILVENPSVEDLDEIVERCKAGRLPWWHIAVWCARHGEDIVPDGGHKTDLYPWLHLGYRINDDHRRSNERNLISRGMLKERVDWYSYFPYIDTVTRTQGNVTMRSFLRNIDLESIDDYALVLMNRHIGCHHSFVVNILAYYLGIVKHLRPELRANILRSRILEVCEGEWVAIHSDIHKLVRASQTFFGLDLTNQEYAHLQYTPGMYGRRNYTLDPTAEIIKRREPRLSRKNRVGGMGSNREEYITDFKEGVEEAYQNLRKKKKHSWVNFNEFFKTRYEWATGGSVTNLPPDMKHLKETVDFIVEVQEQIVKQSRDANKKIVMERLSSPAELAYYLTKHWAYNMTSLTTKPNEPAKKRVLMPGSFLHYVAMSYVLGMVERTGDVGGVRIGDPEDNNLSHFDLRMANSTFNFMLDFADHNAQHSGIEMAIIIECLEEKFAAATDAEDLHFFINWIVDSFFNMMVRDGDSIHSVTAGLFTGWRGTTWINSVACQAYVYVGARAAVRMYGSLDIRYFEGAGDDVLIKFGSAVDAFRFYKCMKLSGYDMQSIKQMASHRKTEFLRVLSVGNSLYCCINRVLPNFICGDLERSNPTLLERVGGAYATIKMMSRRGLSPNVVKCLYKSYMDKWMRVKIGDEYKDIDRTVLHAAKELGGLGIPDEDGLIWYTTKRVNIEVVPIKVSGCPNHASKDYADMMAEDLGRKGFVLNRTQFADACSKAVYGEQSKVIPEKLVDVGAPLRRKVRPNQSTNHEYLQEVMSRVNDQYCVDYKQQKARYGKYQTAIPFLDAPKDVVLRALGITIDIEADDEMKLSTYHCFIIPEYMLYNIGIFFRSRVAFGLMGVVEAEAGFMMCANTAAEVFHGTLNL